MGKWFDSQEVKVAFHLPVHDNPMRDTQTGKLVLRPLWNLIAQVQERILYHWDGLSREAFGIGYFRMKDGRVLLDVYVRLFLKIKRKEMDTLLMILRDFWAHTTQESVYLELQTITIQFLSW